MTNGELITELQKFPADSTPQLMALDYAPKVQPSISNVVDLNGSKTPTNPLLLFFFGPGVTFTYDATGYQNISNA